MSSFVPHTPKAQPLKVEVGKDPVIEKLVVEGAGGVLGVFIGVMFYSLSALRDRQDFRGFQFEGVDSPLTRPWSYKSSNGFLYNNQNMSGTRTLVHASHVLREVPK